MYKTYNIWCIRLVNHGSSASQSTCPTAHSASVTVFEANINKAFSRVTAREISRRNFLVSIKSRNIFIYTWFPLREIHFNTFMDRFSKNGKNNTYSCFLCLKSYIPQAIYTQKDYWICEWQWCLEITSYLLAFSAHKKLKMYSKWNLLPVLLESWVYCMDRL